MFGSMIATAFARIFKNNLSTEVIHFIFDSYIDSSLKSGDRWIRLAKGKAMITGNTQLPEKNG